VVLKLNFERLNQISTIGDWKKAYTEEVEKLDILYQEEEKLYYLMYAQGRQNPRLEEIQSIKHELMTNERLKETFIFWKKTFKDDPVWHRRLSVLLSKMEQESIDSEIELVELQKQLQGNLLTSNINVKGKEYNLGTVHSNIMENPNRQIRKQLLQAAKTIGEKNENLFRKLIQKRNKLARDLGHTNYYHFRCSLKEINIEKYLYEMENLIARSSDSSIYWNKRIKDKFGWEIIHHYDQYFSTFNFCELDEQHFTSSRMKEVLNDVVDSLGIDMNQLPVTIESLEIPYGGFCININPDDIKLVVNKRDSYSVFLSGLHELGHAIDGHYSSYEYPELYRFYSSIAAEGFAELFQTIIVNKEFLIKHFDVQPNTYSQIEELNHLIDLNMVKINYYYSLVEYELYHNPEQSFQKTANECYKHVFGYKGETFHPASEMFYIESPVFFQDYNFALAIRDMIRNKFRIKSAYRNTEVFHEILEKYIKPNQLYSWQKRVEELCGESHTFEYLANTLAKKPQW
jgi:oligoendopeptidase F